MLNKSVNIFKNQYECLSKNELFGYIRRETSDENKIRIERHLIECEHCFSAYQGVANSENVGKIERDLYDIRKEIKIRSASGYFRKSSFRLYLSAAAVFVIGFCLLLLLNSKNEGEVLFEKYFEPYPNVFPIFRDYELNNTVNTAFQKYDNEDYQGAEELFEQILESGKTDSRIFFYYGICCLIQDEPLRAIGSFNKMRGGSKDLLMEQSDYYKGLAFIQLNDLSNAKKILRLLINENGTYKDKALRIFREIE